MEMGTEWRRVCLALLSLLLFAARLHAQINLDPTVPDSMGVEIHFTDPRPGEMRALAAAGFHWIRMDLAWSATETTPGHYDFAGYDRLLAALSPYHIRPILILDYGNRLYDGGLPPHTDEGRDAFARWAVAAASHFAGRGVVWELWNEPNFIRFWQPKPNVQDYVRLALTVGEKFYESVPGEMLIGPSSALIDPLFIRPCIGAGLLNFWSGVSVHPYRQLEPETARPEFQGLGELIAQKEPKGKQVPIVVSEWGYSVGWKPMKGMDETMQARMLAREFLSNLASGVPVTIWYEWTDHDNLPGDPEGQFGLIRDPGDGKTHPPAYIPKPAYRAAQALAESFKGYRFDRRLKLASPDDYVLVFNNGKDERVAAWTRSPGAHEVTIPGLRGRFHLTGYLADQAAAGKAGRHGLALKLTSDPVYVSRGR